MQNEATVYSQEYVNTLIDILREARREAAFWKRRCDVEAGRALEWKDEAAMWCKTAHERARIIHAAGRN